MLKSAFCILALNLSLLLSSNAFSAEFVQLALAPIPVTEEDQNARPQRMITMLEERVRKLKADDKQDDAKAVINRAHQRVRQGEKRLAEQVEATHEVVEKIGNGEEIDLDETELPMLETEIRKLQKSTRRLVKDGKKEEASKLADKMHKQVREATAKRSSQFAKMHKAIEAVGKKQFAVAKEEHGKDGHDDDHAHKDGDHDEHGDDDHGHDGHEQAGHDDNDHHAEDGHGHEHEHDEAGHDDDHGHGDHGHEHSHEGELKELQEEIEELRDEIDELRVLIRQLRRRVK